MPQENHLQLWQHNCCWNKSVTIEESVFLVFLLRNGLNWATSWSSACKNEMGFLRKPRSVVNQQLATYFYFSIEEEGEKMSRKKLGNEEGRRRSGITKKKNEELDMLQRADSAPTSESIETGRLNSLIGIRN